MDRGRRRSAAMQCDRDISVSDRDPAVEFELFFQSEDALKPAGALLRVAHSQSKVTYGAQLKRNFSHVFESGTCEASAASISFKRRHPTSERTPHRTSTKAAQPKGMPLTIGSSTTGRAGKKSRPAQRPQTQNSEYVVGEINA